VGCVVMRNLIIASLLAGLALPSAVRAEPYLLDKAHAHLIFSVDHLRFSLVRGRFTDFDLEMDFDPEDPEAAEVSVTIQADSFLSFSAARDKAVKGKSLLNVKEYPTITFVSKEIELLEGNDALVIGDLTMVGETHEERFNATLRRAGENELTMRTTAGFSVEGQIDRRDYGMTWGLGAVGALIDFNLDIEAYVEE